MVGAGRVIPNGDRRTSVSEDDVRGNDSWSRSVTRWVWLDETVLGGGTAGRRDGVGTGAGTITNAPKAGNPNRYILINENGCLGYIPVWTAA